MLFFDLCREKVYADVSKWINGRCGDVFQKSSSHLFSWKKKFELSQANVFSSEKEDVGEGEGGEEVVKVGKKLGNVGN